MKTKRFECVSLLLGLAVLLTSVACSKKVAHVTPPAPPSPSPTATLAAAPEKIEQGQSTTLTWQTSNATEISIPGLGTLPASGSKLVSPNSSTTYTLVAKGTGGERDTSARVTVNAKMAEAATSPSNEDLFRRKVKDVFFDYNESNVRPDEVTATQSDAAFLNQHANLKVLIEGHCDERGSEEYNLALGANRAESVKQSLIEQGISIDRLRTVSYGKERPFCDQETEQCWQENRVDHLVLQR